MTPIITIAYLTVIILDYGFAGAMISRGQYDIVAFGWDCLFTFCWLPVLINGVQNKGVK